MADKKNKDEEDDEDTKSSEEGEEGEGGQAEGADAAKAKKKRKMIIIIVAAVLLLGGIGAGVYFSGILSGSGKADTNLKKGKKKKASGEESPEHTTGSSVKAVKSNPNEWVPGVIPGHENDDVVYYNLPEFLVNLNTSGKQTSFIKMKITLETPSDSDADAIDSRLPRITDNFNTYLRELRTSDIAGSAGLYRLREELLLRVNKTIYPSKVNDILFREIIVQ